MSDKVREQIAESMELSKTPINAKRARELLRPAASTMSKLENGGANIGPGNFWQWIHGVGDYAAETVKGTVNAIAHAGTSHQKLNEENSTWGWG